MPQEISFSIPVSGTISIEGNKITIRVNETETSFRLPGEVAIKKKENYEPGKTLSDIALEAAQELVRRNGSANRFSMRDLFKLVQ